MVWKVLVPADFVFYKGEIPLRVARVYHLHLDQTSRYTANYDHMTANRIDVIELACEEYSQEVLGFSDSVAYGNPSPDYDPIRPVTSSILNHKDYTPGIVKKLKLLKPTKTLNPTFDEASEVELKDLPPHLEYAFLEGDTSCRHHSKKRLRIGERQLLARFLSAPPGEPSHETSPISRVLSREFVLTNPYGIGLRTQQFRSQRTGKNQRSMTTTRKRLKNFLDRMINLSRSLNSPWVKEGIVLGHKISKSSIEVDRAKVEVIAKLPHPTTVKGVC
ncbi:hypothetical protein Tco_1042974 [Tanacetum coccineum]|uniref:Reverse transcriptase domain-containing protein n=1 Tax=Tanacetum coccineum TaxID=301880 RepID=A0ABQ5GM32_9ASTR